MNRLRPLVAVLVLVAAFVAASGASARPTATPLDDLVFSKINAFRVAHGVRPLKISPQLNAAAAQHSQEMVDKGYFDHNSFDGTSPFTRIKRFYPSNGYRAWSVGENIVWGSPSITAAGALRAWMSDQGHLQNMLDTHWRQIGVSAIHSDSAPAYYKGQPVTVITTDFGFRHK